MNKGYPHKFVHIKVDWLIDDALFYTRIDLVTLITAILNLLKNLTSFLDFPLYKWKAWEQGL